MARHFDLLALSFLTAASTIALCVLAYLIVFRRWGDSFLYRGRVSDAEKDYGQLAGDPLRPNPDLKGLPAWKEAHVRTLNSLYPQSEHFALLDLHNELQSPIIRTGPNQVHVADVTSPRSIFAAQTRFAKGRLYDVFRVGDIKDIFTMRYKEEHGPRRKLLLHAFAPASVNNLRPFIVRKLAAMLQVIFNEKSQLEMYSMFQTLTGDVSFRLVFGEDAHMVESGCLDPIVLGIRQRIKAQPQSHRAYQLLNLAPFLSPLITCLPNKIRHEVQGMRQLDQAVRRRIVTIMKGGHEHTEVFQRLASVVDEVTGKRLTVEEMAAEAVSLLFAGIETTAMVLTYLNWRLAKDAELYGKLLDELKSIMTASKLQEVSEGVLKLPEPSDIAKLPLLDAILKEVLRMYPGVVKPLPRIVPRGGITFHGFYLPAGTEIGCSAWVQHRWQPELWGNDPLEFHPGRWFDAQEEPSRLAEMNRSLVPFSTGPRACIGKELAKEILYLTTAALFRHLRPSPSGPLTSDEDMKLLGFFASFPKGYRLDMSWEQVE